MPQFFYRVEWPDGELTDYNLENPAFLEKHQKGPRWQRKTKDGIETATAVWLLVWAETEKDNK